jgi:DNA-binding MarR family transcriptional regulator
MPYIGPAGREPKLLYLVKQVELAARSRLDEIFRPAGLTALQYTALTVLERHADMSAAQLARHSFVTAQSMGDMVAALQSRGLIERHRDRADRRRLVVALTADGHALLDRYRDAVADLETAMLAGLSEQAVAALRQTLRACHDNLAGNAPLSDEESLSQGSHATA